MYVLETRGLTKAFPTVVANKNVNFQVELGEVHALLGENGAGKTTLMSTIYGLHSPDSGEIFFKGRRIRFRSPADAIRHGVYMVQQHFSLVSRLTVAENIALIPSYLRSPLIRPSSLMRTAEQLARAYDLDIDPSMTIEELPIGVQQRVEVLKALSSNAELLLMDEPTSVLTPNEIDQLFLSLRKMAQRGISIVISTHKLDEVFRIADRVTVLRDGQVFFVGKIGELNSVIELARQMVGRDIDLKLDRPPNKIGDEVLRVENLCVYSDRDFLAIDNLNLSVHAGEILGIAGAAGNGQSELVQCIYGSIEIARGKVLMMGQDATDLGVSERKKFRISYVPEDGYITGLAPDFTVAENLILTEYEKTEYSKGLVLDYDAIRKHAEDLISKFDIRPPIGSIPARRLSGGNMQKVILARELSKNSNLVVISNPTKGLDIRTTLEIRRRILALRAMGAGIILVSEDLGEILELSDTIAVMFRGKVLDTLSSAEADLSKIGLLLGGQKSSGTT